MSALLEAGALLCACVALYVVYYTGRAVGVLPKGDVRRDRWWLAMSVAFCLQLGALHLARMLGQQ